MGGVQSLLRVLRAVILQWWSQQEVSVSPGDFLKIEIVGPYTRPAVSETVEVEPSDLYFK